MECLTQCRLDVNGDLSQYFSLCYPVSLCKKSGWIISSVYLKYWKSKERKHARSETPCIFDWLNVSRLYCSLHLLYGNYYFFHFVKTVYEHFLHLFPNQLLIISIFIHFFLAYLVWKKKLEWLISLKYLNGEKVEKEKTILKKLSLISRPLQCFALQSLRYLLTHFFTLIFNYLQFSIQQHI